MVKSNQIYTPQTFVEKVAGRCYCFRNENTVAEMEQVLRHHRQPFSNYALNEIEHIVENMLEVVLVDVSGFDTKGRWQREYRWFEVSKGFSNKEE